MEPPNVQKKKRRLTTKEPAIKLWLLLSSLASKKLCEGKWQDLLDALPEEQPFSRQNTSDTQDSQHQTNEFFRLARGGSLSAANRFLSSKGIAEIGNEEKIFSKIFLELILHIHLLISLPLMTLPIQALNWMEVSSKNASGRNVQARDVVQPGNAMNIYKFLSLTMKLGKMSLNSETSLQTAIFQKNWCMDLGSLHLFP